MNISIPPGLEKHTREFGEEGARWLASLPEHITELEKTWGFCCSCAFDRGGTASFVAPVTLNNGSEAVLKIGFPHHEARFESDALRFLNGDGAVRLLQVSEDGFSLLMERCVLGTDLWSQGDEAADDVACELLPRLWRVPVPERPFVSLSDFTAAWWEDLPRITTLGSYDKALVEQAVVRGRELAATQTRTVVLHGDFHPGNVLAAQREPWLVIDPKPLVGEPAYDLAQWLYNRYEAALLTGDPVSAVRKQIDRFAAKLDLEPARIAGWTFVKALGWDWGQEALSFFNEVAQPW